MYRIVESARVLRPSRSQCGGCEVGGWRLEVGRCFTEVTRKVKRDLVDAER